jgi:hypothetical protein
VNRALVVTGFAVLALAAVLALGTPGASNLHGGLAILGCAAAIVGAWLPE